MQQMLYVNYNVYIYHHGNKGDVFVCGGNMKYNKITAL